MTERNTTLDKALEGLYKNFRFERLTKGKLPEPQSQQINLLSFIKKGD